MEEKVIVVVLSLPFGRQGYLCRHCSFDSRWSLDRGCSRCLSKGLSLVVQAVFVSHAGVLH